jgi:lipoprotein-anchoring transpeptidase ErfK/SrfK
LDPARFALWFLGALCVICVAGALSLIRVERGDRILRGVHALGIDLGGRSKAQAARTLRGVWDQRTIEVVADEVVGLHTPSELGIVLDGAAMADTAHALSRSASHIEAIVRQEPPISVAPIWGIDATISERFMNQLASRFNQPRRDASISREGTSVQVYPAEVGRALHVGDAVTWLQQHASDLLVDRRWELPVLVLEPMIDDASAAAAEARDLLANSLSLRLYDPIADEASTWTLSPAVWAPWVKLGLQGQRPAALEWELDAAKAETGLSGRMAALYPELELSMSQAVPAVTEAIGSGSWQAELRLFHKPVQYTVQEDETLASIAFDHGIPYPWIQHANPGFTDTIRVGQVLVIPSPDLLMPLPIVEGKRITVSLSSQMMWAYQNGELLWEWPVSTGIDSSPTSPGVFQVQTHELEAYGAEWDLYMPHFVGIYEPGPNADLMNGFHGFPWRDGTQLLWTNDLGRPATYGCILLSSDNAARLYEWAEEGTVVVIRP